VVEGLAHAHIIQRELGGVQVNMLPLIARLVQNFVQAAGFDLIQIGGVGDGQAAGTGDHIHLTALQSGDDGGGLGVEADDDGADRRLAQRERLIRLEQGQFLSGDPLGEIVGAITRDGGPVNGGLFGGGDITDDMRGKEPTGNAHSPVDRVDNRANLIAVAGFSVISLERGKVNVAFQGAFSGGLGLGFAHVDGLEGFGVDLDHVINLFGRGASGNFHLGIHDQLPAVDGIRRSNGGAVRPAPIIADLVSDFHMAIGAFANEYGATVVNIRHAFAAQRDPGGGFILAHAAQQPGAVDDGARHHGAD